MARPTRPTGRAKTVAELDAQVRPGGRVPATDELHIQDRIRQLNDTVRQLCRLANLSLTKLAQQVALRTHDSTTTVERDIRAPHVDCFAIWPHVADILGDDRHLICDLAALAVSTGSEKNGIQSFDLAICTVMARRGLLTGAVANALQISRQLLTRRVLAGELPANKPDFTRHLATFLDLSDPQLEAMLRYSQARQALRTQEMSTDAASLRTAILAASHRAQQPYPTWAERQGISASAISAILIGGLPPTAPAVITALRQALALDERGFASACRLLREEGPLLGDERERSPTIRTRLQDLLEDTIASKGWRTNAEAASHLLIGSTTLGRLRTSPGFMPRANVCLQLMAWYKLSAAMLADLIHTTTGTTAQEDELVAIFRDLSPKKRRQLLGQASALLNGHDQTLTVPET